jgi:hypothetical protein
MELEYWQIVVIVLLTWVIVGGIVSTFLGKIIKWGSKDNDL